MRPECLGLYQDWREGAPGFRRAGSDRGAGRRHAGADDDPAVWREGLHRTRSYRQEEEEEEICAAGQISRLCSHWSDHDAAFRSVFMA